MPLIDWYDRRTPTIISEESKIRGVLSDHEIQASTKRWRLTHTNHQIVIVLEISRISPHFPCETGIGHVLEVGHEDVL